MTLSRLIRTSIFRLVSVGLLSFGVGLPLPRVLAAEELTTTINGVKLAMPLTDLEQFAQTGQISANFAPLAQALDQPTRDRFQKILLKRVTLDPAQLQRLIDTPLVQPFFESLGRAFQTPSGENGKAEIEAAVVRADADPQDGLTLLNVMRQFPEPRIQVDVPALIELITVLESINDYRIAAVSAVIQASQQELQQANNQALPDNLLDLRAVGSYAVEQQSRTFTIPHPRLTETGLAPSYEMPVDFYLPERTAAPLIVMSHGFGATRANYAYLAQFLASYGFAVAALEHIGSDLQYRQAFLSGELSDIVQPAEYIERSRDITYLLDTLEQLAQQEPTWGRRIDLQSVGVMGNSLGGTTALSVAGAAFNPTRLQQACAPDQIIVTVSMLLQCIAQTAPFQAGQTNLRDPRIKAVLAAYPLTSSLFGPEGMGQITVPTLIMAGSNDFIAPVAQDQIQPFIWLGTSHKYLALLTPGTHFSSSDDAYVEGFPAALLGPSTALGRTYLQALSVAFFGRYLNPSGNAYRAYLSESYLNTLSQEPLQLHLIHSLTPAQIQQAYGEPLPYPIIPSEVSQFNHQLR